MWWIGKAWRVIFRRSTSWLPILLVPLLAAVILGWLLLVFAGSHGMALLPAAEGAAVDYAVDKEGRWSREETENLPPERWRRVSSEKFLKCKPGEILWLRIRLSNAGDKPLSGVLENADYFADRVEAWITEGGERLHWLSGEKVRAGEKILAGREVAFPVGVPPQGERVILLRVEDLLMPYVRLAWWPDERAFQLGRMRGGLAEGIYFGGLLALLGYNTLLWLRLRQADVGLYVLYLGTVAVFMFLARGHLPGFGFPFGSPELQTALAVAMALSGVFLTLFAKVFLELKSHLPWADAWVRRWSSGLAVLVVPALLTPDIPWMAVMTLTTGLTHAGLLILAVAAWRKGAGQARFFLASFGGLFAGSLPMVAVWFYDSSFRDLGMRALMIGSALEMLMLSLAVADRFARAQKKLIEETEYHRLIEETYADELEEEVRERTRELREANADKDRMLAVIGHDLRSPLTGLMRSADERAGEFARDVARTGRALLLMIEDLVLWARLRAGTRMTSVHLASALMAPGVALHHALAEQGGVQLILQVPERMRVETDLVLAQTLVRNLLANALKFAQTRVVLRAEAAGDDSVRITVSNDGPTLSESVAARLAAGEDAPVTATGGLGLKLCREICRVLEMRLEAGRSADELTEFRFTLKRAADAPESNA